MNGGWIGVDLDGTLAEYDSWRGSTHIGGPIPLMVGRVQEWLGKGLTVKVFTARVSHDGTPDRIREADRAREAISAWCLQHVGAELPITNVKDYGMIELWDDRCVQVEPNTGVRIGRSTRGL